LQVIGLTTISKDPCWRSSVAAERRVRTREKLLGAAARVVSELGETRARIDDFIAAAGISRGSFYNYYSTREQLLADLWARVGSEPFYEIQQVSQLILDPAERLATEARLVLLRATRDSIWGWLVYSMSASKQVPQDLLSYPRPDLIIGHRQGRFQFSNLDCANDLVVSALRRALLSVLEQERGDGYASGIVELLLRALGLDHKEAEAIATRPLLDASGKRGIASTKQSKRPLGVKGNVRKAKINKTRATQRALVTKNN
jgi:AcrR family transcriptional regulator